MPRTCTICTHLKCDEVNRALLEGQAYRDIARQFQVGKDSLLRHKDHLPKQLVKAHEQEDVRQAIDVVKQLKAINGATLSILKEARDAGNGELALRAVDRIQRQIELQAKLLGELQQEGTTHVHLSPEWLHLRAVVVQALLPYPEAAQAIGRALSEHR